MLNLNQIEKFKSQVSYFEPSCDKIKELKRVVRRILSKLFLSLLFGVATIIMHKKHLFSNKFYIDHIISHVLISLLFLIYLYWVLNSISDSISTFKQIKREKTINDELDKTISKSIDDEPLFKDEYKLYLKYKRLK